MPEVREQAALLALVKRASKEWYLVAQLLEFTGSALKAIHHEWTGFEPPDLLSAVTNFDVTDAELD